MDVPGWFWVFLGMFAILYLAGALWMLWYSTTLGTCKLPKPPAPPPFIKEK
jgi:hypothetical protein